MTRLAILLLALPVALAACGGGTDRGAAAKSTAQAYWYDIGHGKWSNAFDLLSSGTQVSIGGRQTYVKSMLSFVQQTNGVAASVGKAQVVGDCALVPVNVTYARTGSTTHGYQHMYWLDGKWRITEGNGGLVQHPATLTCPTGT